MFRRLSGFTLIELLVIVAIMASMITVGVVGLSSSRGASRVFGAGRDVMAIIRRARSFAIITQQPILIEYANEKVDDEPCVRVSLKTKEGDAPRLFSTRKSRGKVYNLAGEVVIEAEATEGGEGDGETIEDVMSADAISADVMKGLCIKVEDDSLRLANLDNEQSASKVSIFSTADSMLRTVTSAQTKVKDEGALEAEVPEADVSAAAVSEIGKVSPPHRIWIYQDGADYHSGLCITVDEYGEPKCEEIDR